MGPHDGVDSGRQEGGSDGYDDECRLDHDAPQAFLERVTQQDDDLVHFVEELDQSLHSLILVGIDNEGEASLMMAAIL